MNHAPDHRRPLAGSNRPRSVAHKLLGAGRPGRRSSEVSLVVRARPGSPPLPDLAHWQATSLAERKYLTPDEYVRTCGAEDLGAVAATPTCRGN